MVPAEGPVPAKIMFIGEAPGETEVKEGRPFVGQAGRLLDSVLEEVKVKRADCYVTNVMKERPAGNDFTRFDAGELAQGYAILQEELARVNPNLVVLMGNEPMKALLGHRGVLDWRGSVVTDTTGRKCLITVHPSAVLHDWTLRSAMVCDLGRLSHESSFPEVRRTERTLLTNLSFKELCDELDSYQSKAEYLAFDIEVESSQITCIGLSSRLNRAVTVPFWWGASGSLWTKEEELTLWKKIKKMLEDPAIGKIAHNATYDMEILERTIGIKVNGLWMDTMVAAHALYLELPKSLAFLTSIYTDHPYYKYQRKTGSMDEYWRYNATDACLTFEIASKLRDDMIDFGVWDFYKQHLHPLISPLYRMGMRGVRFDVARCRVLRNRYGRALARMQDYLDRLVGHTLNTNSNPQMVHWLYTELGLPKVMKKRASGMRTLSADEDTLGELKAKHDIRALDVVLAMRKLNKILSTYLEVSLDEDHRIRTSYLITGTETGRLSSRETYRGTGTNLQNIPPGDVRRLFLADEGCVLINGDLSQAEARVVAYLGPEKRLIEVFESGGDIHRKNASAIFQSPEGRITDVQRQLAKRVVHASNYGMGPLTFAKNAGITMGEAKVLLNAYFARYPGIRYWHMQTQATLKKTRILTTPLGRKRMFMNKWDDSLLKEALAYIPQSTVADIINDAIIELDALIEKFKMPITLLLQVHDSIVAQCPDEPGTIKATIDVMRSSMQRPVRIGSRTLTIPADFKVGKNWEDMTKWK